MRAAGAGRGAARARAHPRRRAETRPGSAQSARRRAPRARAASRGAARVAQVETGAGATPGLKFQLPGWARSTTLPAGGPRASEQPGKEEALRGGAKTARSPRPSSLRAAGLPRLRPGRWWKKWGAPRWAPSEARGGVPAAGTRAGRGPGRTAAVAAADL